jgi:hypothetical protein
VKGEKEEEEEEDGIMAPHFADIFWLGTVRRSHAIVQSLMFGADEGWVLSPGDQP